MQREEPYQGLTCRFTELKREGPGFREPAQVVHGCRQLVS